MQPSLCLQCDVVKIPSTQLEGSVWIVQGEVALTLRIYPDTGSSKAGFETLNPNDGKKEPKEADEKPDVHQERGSSFETAKNDLGSSS